MRWAWPFLIYVGVAIVHLVALGFSAPWNSTTKALLMPALLLAVLLVASWTRRGRLVGPRAWWGIGLLGAGIVASFLGDLLLGVSFIAGLASFAVAHLLYIAVFNGPARQRLIRWWSLAYIAVAIAVLVVLWPDLGDLRPVVAVYGAVLAITAMTATRVNLTTAIGGGLFLASDALLAFRLFSPGFEAIFPDPWQDVVIMLLYCAGEGLIALGVLRRLELGAGRVR
jgi:uncharacterized membrane protein YhhN